MTLIFDHHTELTDRNKWNETCKIKLITAVFLAWGRIWSICQKKLSCLFPSRKSGLYFSLMLSCHSLSCKIQNMSFIYIISKKKHQKFIKNSYKVLRWTWKTMRKTSITLLTFAQLSVSASSISVSWLFPGFAMVLCL